MEPSYTGSKKSRTRLKVAIKMINESKNTFINVKQWIYMYRMKEHYKQRMEINWFNLSVILYE